MQVSADLRKEVDMKRGRQDQIALAHYKYEERIRVGGPKVRKVHRRLALASLLRLSKRESSRQEKNMAREGM